MTTTLRGITWEHERGHGSIVGASAEYMRLNPDVELTWEARSLQSFADQPIESLAPTNDLLVIDHPHVPAAAAEGLLLPLDDALPDDLDASSFIGRSFDSYRYEGRVYGLATDAAAQVAAYRPDLLSAAPGTWADVLELARDGRVLWPAKPIDAFSSLVTTTAQHGGAVMASSGSFAERVPLTAAWDLLLALADAVPSECLTLNPIEVAERLADGSQYAYSPLLFGYTNYSRRGYRENLLRYTDIPVRSVGDAPVGSLLGGAGIAVSASSAEPDAAVAFAVWLASSDVQRGAYFAGGGQPGHIAAWEDESLDAEASGFFSGTRRTLEGATLRPRHPRYIGFQDEASVVINGALAARAPIGPLADELDALLDAHLGGEHADR